MADDKKGSRASRVLRFTVTSALVMAPLAGCGSSSVEPEGPNVNTGPVEEPPRYAPNPGPEERSPQPAPEPPGPLLPNVNAMPRDEVDAGAGSGPSVPAPGPRQPPHRPHANPGPSDVPVES